MEDLSNFEIGFIIFCVLMITVVPVIVARWLTRRSTSAITEKNMEISKLINSLGKFPKKNKVLTIIRKDYKVNVLKVRLKDLDKSKCSHKFLANNLNENTFVYVRCDAEGNIDYRNRSSIKNPDKQNEYRIYSVEEHELVK